MEKTTIARAYFKAQYLQETAGTYFGERPSFEDWICLKAMEMEKKMELVKESDSLPCVRLSLPDADEITNAGIEYAELPDECTLDDERLNDCKHFIGGATWYHKRIKGNEA